MEIQNRIGEKIFPLPSRGTSPKCVPKFQKIVQFFVERGGGGGKKDGEAREKFRSKRRLRGIMAGHFETSVRPRRRRRGGGEEGGGG